MLPPKNCIKEKKLHFLIEKSEYKIKTILTDMGLFINILIQTNRKEQRR
jgi:hypothetical protein